MNKIKWYMLFRRQYTEEIYVKIQEKYGKKHNKFSINYVNYDSVL